MPNKKSQFLTTRRTETLAAFAECRTYNDVANVLCISTGHVAWLARRLGLPRRPNRNRANGPQPRNEPTRRMVPRLRALGLTYQEIGDMMDPPITRERVRQILHDVGRSDLIGHGFKASNMRNREKRRLPRKTWQCAMCGKKRITLPSQEGIYCSRDCYWDALREITLERGPQIYKMRQRGVKWKVIAQKFDMLYPNDNYGAAVRCLTKWAEYTGTDISDVHRPQQHKKKVPA